MAVLLLLYERNRVIGLRVGPINKQIQAFVHNVYADKFIKQISRETQNLHMYKSAYSF